MNSIAKTDDSTGRLAGAFLKWTDAAGWVDRDGLPPPKPLIGVGTTTFAGNWSKNDAGGAVFTRAPLEELDQRNAVVAPEQWEKDLAGKPRPPWRQFYAVGFIHEATGQRFRYEAETTGARIAIEELEDAWQGRKLLAGANVLPIVELIDVAWKTSFGTRKRPKLHIVGYFTPLGAASIGAAPPTPQITGPATAAAPTPEPAPKPEPAEQPKPAQQARPKPAVKLAAASPDANDRRSLGEIMDDELPY